MKVKLLSNVMKLCNKNTKKVEKTERDERIDKKHIYYRIICSFYKQVVVVTENLYRIEWSEKHQKNGI